MDPPDVVPIEAVPLEKVGVRVVEVPVVMDAAPAVSDVAVGAATAVMVIVWLVAVPSLLVTVRT